MAVPILLMVKSLIFNSSNPWAGCQKLKTRKKSPKLLPIPHSPFPIPKKPKYF